MAFLVRHGTPSTRCADTPAFPTDELWRVGLVPRPTYGYGSGYGRQRPHLPRQQLIIFMTLHLNSLKRMACVLPLYTIPMITCGQEMAQSGQVLSRYFGGDKTIFGMASVFFSAVSASQTWPRFLAAR